MDSETKKPSFSKLVLSKALTNTVHVFKSKLRDAGYVLLSLIVGCFLYLMAFGAPRAMTEALPILMFSFAPLGVFVFCVLIWHLAIAPEELVYTAIAELPTGTAPSTPTTPVKKERPINWSIWKQMPNYTVSQLAGILARTEPSAGGGYERNAYQELILSDIGNSKLQYIVEYGAGFYGDSHYVKSVDEDTKISRDAAILWAKSKSFPIDHIE